MKVFMSNSEIEIAILMVLVYAIFSVNRTIRDLQGSLSEFQKNTEIKWEEYKKSSSLNRRSKLVHIGFGKYIDLSAICLIIDQGSSGCTINTSSGEWLSVPVEFIKLVEEMGWPKLSSIPTDPDHRT